MPVIEKMEKDINTIIRNELNKGKSEYHRINGQLQIEDTEWRKLIHLRNDYKEQIEELDRRKEVLTQAKEKATLDREKHFLQLHINQAEQGIREIKEESDENDRLEQQVCDNVLDFKESLTVKTLEIKKIEQRIAARRLFVNNVRQFLAFNKKSYLLLAWDGGYSLDGDCNKQTGKDLAVEYGGDIRNDRLKWPLRRTEAVPVNRAQMGDLSTISNRLEVSAISVRRYQCEKDLTPGIKRCGLKIGIKRIDRVKSLLFRVFDKNNKMVYQELFKGDELFCLMPAESLTEEQDIGAAFDSVYTSVQDGVNAEVTRPEHGFASKEHNPYTSMVWVANTEDAFDTCFKDSDFENADEPDCAAGRLVNFGFKHDGMSDGKKGRVDELEGGDNTFEVKDDVCISNVVIHKTLTTLNVKDGAPAITAGSIEAEYKKRVDAVFDNIDRAIEKIGEPADENEYNIYLGPEWYFTRSITREGANELLAHERWYLSADEKEGIYTYLEEKFNGDDKYKKWVIIPGSILWGLDAKEIEEARDLHFSLINNTLPVFYWDGELKSKEISKATHGNDTPYNIQPMRIPWTDFGPLTGNKNDSLPVPEALFNLIKSALPMKPEFLEDGKLKVLDDDNTIWSFPIKKKSTVTEIILLKEGNELIAIPQSFFGMNIHEFQGGGRRKRRVAGVLRQMPSRGLPGRLFR
ncbi:hypothetical protein ACFL5V_02840 [Fibrobacterota bacterium]